MRLRPPHIVGVALGALSLGLAVVFYDRLPSLVPVHWDIAGKVNGWAPKPWGAFFFPCLIISVALLAMVLPDMSPKGFRIEPFARVFDLIMLALVALLTCLWATLLAGALGAHLPIERIAPGCVGAVLMVLGNFLGKITPNFFIGVKTPWTLASREVWLRTHRLGGRLLLIAGFALFIAGALRLDLVIPVLLVIAAGLAPIGYSFLLYRKLEAAAVKDEPSMQPLE